MAEAVIRRHRRNTERWMGPARRRRGRVQLREALRFVIKAMPGYLLSFADVLGMPSGMHAAYGTALAALGMDVRPVAAGGFAALFVRLVCGLPPRWELLVSVAGLLAAPILLGGRGSGWVMAYTAALLLPAGVKASMSSTAAQLLQGWGAVVSAAMSAPVIARGVRALTGDRHISAVEERLAVGYLAALCICGSARMLVLGVNAGVFLAACLTISMALVLGTGAATACGMLAGVSLALQGIPLTMAVALGLGGFLAGIAGSLTHRRLSCGAFAMGGYLPLLLCYGTGMGCGAGVLGAAVTMGLLGRKETEALHGLLRRFLPNDPAPGDAYASAALSAWEQTVSALARAVPVPRDDAQDRSGAWWQNHLCQGCPELEDCACMSSALGQAKAEAVWARRDADEAIWQDALDYLRGMGCQRLYHLMDGMYALRREHEAAGRTLRQMEAQRGMLVTHLTALSGAARRFAALSSGESWWDTMAAGRIRAKLSELATPAGLMYVRRVQGHVQAGIELQHITGARRQAEELCTLVSAVLKTPMQLMSIDGDRVLLAEAPLFTVQTGAAFEPIDGDAVCGDAAWTGILSDGRSLAALSDGMGHGESAARSSRQTVELIRLCLEAGYSRHQTLTAVNGMLLLGGRGEDFATADVLTIDLWTGQACLDKLGAASSWLWHRGELTRMVGDALPLGILEEIDLSGCSFRLEDGDAVILMTDGVEEAFPDAEALEAALADALLCETAGDAARSLLQAAFDADASLRRDDQSAVFVRIGRTART